MIDFILYNDLALSFAIENVITFSFVLTFLIVLIRYKSEKSLKLGALVYASSYILSNIAYGTLELLPNGSLIGPDFFYLQWIMYESLTIILCFMIHLSMKIQHHEAVINAYRLSCINMFSCLIVHYLAIVKSVPDHWFYSVYSITVNTTAFLIVFLFVFNIKRSVDSCFLKFRLS